MKNEVGLKLIAFSLGVSITTVSRALRDCSDISESMKAKVREKAVELKYTPNLMARSLATGKSNFICVIMDSMLSPYFSVIIDGISKKFQKLGYNICLLPTGNRFLDRNNIKEAAAVGAAAIITFLVPNKDAVEYSILFNIPLLVFGRSTPEKMVNKLYTDDITGGELAASYLINKGHKKLLYVGAELHEVSYIRQKGFVDKANEAGIQDVLVVENDDNVLMSAIENGYDGIFCFDDQLAMKVISKNLNKSIDIVGFNGIYENFGFKYFFSFPSIAPNYQQMIDDAVQILDEQINQDGNYNFVDKKYTVEIV